MEAKQIKLLKFLQDDHQLYIPIFQRKYSWDNDQCKKLFEDILKIGSKKDNSTHFIGSVVYMNEGLDMVGPISKRMIIDGQQRLTTITLLISALAIFLKENPSLDYDYQDLVFYYLSNTRASGEERYKLILNEDDKKSILKIINNISSDNPVDFDKSDSNKIVDSYKFFLSRINENNISTIIAGLNKLNLIQIALEQGTDNPQLIYESLNSTGLELSKADLIRNFVLMTFKPEEQKRIYEMYWKDMEKGFNQTNLFDRFIKDYLTIKLNKIPNISKVYVEFKDFASRWDDVEDLLKEINTYSKYYFSICFGDDEDKDISYAFKKFNNLKSIVSYPFLLSVYKDYADCKITKEELLEIINIVESYVFRRSICDIQTNSLNKTFAHLYNEIDKDNYVESLKSTLLLKKSYKRFPDDEEFRDNFLIKNVYNYAYSRYLLSNLENYKHPKNFLDFTDYTIEHVMPQNISKDWKKDLGENYLEIHEKYLHNLGNLTLTAYNSELSDSSFRHKQEMENGFKDSPLYLNSYIAKLDSWGEKEINNRACDLIKLAIEIWPYPKVDSETLKKYSKGMISFKDYTYGRVHEEVFNKLESMILDLGDVKEIYTFSYIVFKTKYNFVEVRFRENVIHITIKMPFGKVNNPKAIGFKNNYGELVFNISSLDELDYAMDLIKQGYEHIVNK